MPSKASQIRTTTAIAYSRECEMDLITLNEKGRKISSSDVHITPVENGLRRS